MNNKYLLVNEENKTYCSSLKCHFTIRAHYAKAENIDPNTLPKDPNVVNGDATISSINKLAIDQKTDKLSINWSSFNIGKEASVEFFQPSNNSVAVNRVF